MLLSYTFSTTPTPLEVSTPTTPTKGAITVTVTPPGDVSTVYCSQIVVFVPLGDGAADLATTANHPAPSVVSGDWDPPTAFAAEENGSTWAKYTFLPTAPGAPAFTGLVLLLSGTVNTVPGDFPFMIEETTGISQGGMSQSTSTVMLSKGAPMFFLNNLIAGTKAAPTVPVTDVTRADTVYLAWESNGTYFEVYTGADTSVYSGTAKSCSFAAPARDTTVFVVATQGDSKLYDHLTITVSDPVLTPASVTSSGTVESKEGNLVAGSGAAQVGSLAVTGDASAASLALTGALSVGAGGGATLDADALTVRAVKIAGWTVYVDADNTVDLLISNGMHALRVVNSDDASAYQLQVNPHRGTDGQLLSRRTVCDEDSVRLYNSDTSTVYYLQIMATP